MLSEDQQGRLTRDHRCTWTPQGSVASVSCLGHKVHSYRAFQTHPRLSSILLPVHLATRRIELQVKSKKGFRKSVEISKQDEAQFKLSSHKQ